MSTELPIEISVADVKSMMDAGESFLFIDCGEQNEHDYCQIDSAVLIPMRETPNRLDEFAESSRVIVFCHHGMRSLQVANYLRQQGILAAQSMAGGIDRWSVEVDPAVQRY